MPLRRHSPGPGIFRLLTGIALVLSAGLSGRAEPLTFTFPVADRADAESPFAREIFAEVVTPSGTLVRLPAFPETHDRWAIRARGDEPGEYRLGRVVEQLGAEERELRGADPGGKSHRVTAPAARPSVRRDPHDSRRFLASDGSPYVPIGANLAWADGPRVAWHLEAFRQFEANALNWTRIWMAHWGGTNLDWLPDDMGRPPRPGWLDPRIAANWDRILEAAEERGVYVQLVLQHHGQYTTGANSNWAINPWNAAHPGGFLEHPTEFFTSPRAIALTKQKYRYIVARWAHSPAILAWELFNEVHWTNGYVENEPAVAAWHRQMAEYLRSIDPYDHLVTTSLDDLNSPIYEAMDYYQPHLYAINMLTAVRAFEKPLGEIDRPIFWGEIGDDKMPVTDEEKAGGSQLVPQVWASLMGAGPLPGQSWLGEVFVRTGRVSELGAVARFLSTTGLALRPDLEPFSAAMSSAETMPTKWIPGYDWARHRAARVAIKLDGSDDIHAAQIPAILVGNPRSVTEGYLAEFTVTLEVPRATAAQVRFAHAGPEGATVEVLVDDSATGSYVWPALAAADSGPAPRRPAVVEAPLEPGLRRLTLRNTGGRDWVRLEDITFELPTPMLAAAGKRGADFVALYVWNRRGVHALAGETRPTATVHLADLPAGRWTITWWDVDQGKPGTSSEVDHAGGTLDLNTPPIARHAAVVLTR